VTKPKKTRWPGSVMSMEENENEQGTVAANPKGKKPCGRSRLRRHKVKMSLKEIGCMVWTRFM
jgi:hypothetical protein